MILVACAPTRTPFSPDGPTTVGMPEKLSDRERTYIPEIDNALRNQGLVPVKHGRGDFQLDFRMSSGPVNIDTRIAMLENGAELFVANGRAGGVPLIGRENVARKSFDQAYAEFQSGLSSVTSNPDYSSSDSPDLGGGTGELVY